MDKRMVIWVIIAALANAASLLIFTGYILKLMGGWL